MYCRKISKTVYMVNFVGAYKFNNAHEDNYWNGVKNEAEDLNHWREKSSPNTMSK